MKVRRGVFKSVPSQVKWLIYLLSFSNIGAGYFWVATSAYLPERGLTSGDIGLILAVNGLAFIMAAIPLGVMADHKGRKKILLWGLAGMPPALLIYGFTSDFEWLLIASAITGVSEGAFMTTWNAMIADMTAPENRSEAFSLSFLAASLSSGFGLALPLAFPALQGMTGLPSEEMHTVFFVILAALAMLSPITLRRLLKGHNETIGGGISLRKGENLRPMLKFSALNSLIGLGAGIIIPLIPTWMFLRFGAADTFTGPLMALASMTIAFASVGSAGLARRFGMVRAIVMCQGASTVFMMALAFAPGMNMAALFYVVRSALMNMATPLSDSFLMGLITKEERGLASAINSLVWRLPNSVTTVIGGSLLAAGFYVLPFALATACYVAAVSLFYIVFRNHQPLKEDAPAIGDRPSPQG